MAHRAARASGHCEDCWHLGLQCCSGMDCTQRQWKHWDHRIYSPEGWQKDWSKFSTLIGCVNSLQKVLNHLQIKIQKHLHSGSSENHNFCFKYRCTCFGIFPWIFFTGIFHLRIAKLLAPYTFPSVLTRFPVAATKSISTKQLSYHHVSLCGSCIQGGVSYLLHPFVVNNFLLYVLLSTRLVANCILLIALFQ